MNDDIERLVDICHVNLKNSKDCISYLKSRRIPKDLVLKYKFGYFPQNVSRLCEYVSESVMNKLGIINYYGESKFAIHFPLIIPQFSEFGKPIAIIGRTLISEDERTVLGISKYENSIYKKSSHLYGLNLARGHILKNKNVYVVEGQFDQLSMFKNGIKNSVSIGGSSFSKNQLIKLARYTNSITFLLDNDSAGRSGMDNISNKLSQYGLNFSFVTLPRSYKDVDEYFSSGKTKLDFEKDLEEYLPGW